MTNIEPQWIAILKKETVEVDDMPFATAKGLRTVKTTRTWYKNGNVVISKEEVEIIMGAPET